MAVQWIASGTFKDIWEARRAIRDSFPVSEYEPQDRSAWADAYERFLRITVLSPGTESGSEV
jgi:rhamnulokinase